MKNKQSLIALFVLLAMVFTACGDPSGSSASFSTPTGFYVDSSGNVTETDSGRTVVVADDKAKVVFYSDNLASSAQRVGFAYEGKTMIFLFENSKNFPTSMVLSESGASYKGTFTTYDSATQTYSLTLENGGDSATWSKIALSKDIFTQHKDNSGLTASQNLRMRNLHIAMCIYKSLDDYIASGANRQARGIWVGIDKVLQKFFPGPVTSIVVGTIAFGVGAANFMSENPLAMASGLSAINDGAKLIITGMNQAFGGGSTPGGSTFVAVTGITGVPTTASIGSLALSGTVAPTNATNKTIVWSVKSPGATGATISGSTLTTKAAGTVTVTATITNGKAVGTPYTQDFAITIGTTSNFVAVTGITVVTTTASVGSLTLIGYVDPYNATNKTIEWSVKSPGTTGARIIGSGSILMTTAAGTVTVTGTIANGRATGTPYTQDFTITITKAVTYTYTVSYNANGGSGTAPSAQTAADGTRITVAGQGNLSYSGKTFVGWNTSADGKGITYAAGSSMMVTANTTLYAQWGASSATYYTVTYNANGGSGTVPPAQTVAAGTDISLPGRGDLTYPRSYFEGWGDDYNTRDSRWSSWTVTANTTLYAQWGGNYIRCEVVDWASSSLGFKISMASGEWSEPLGVRIYRAKSKGVWAGWGDEVLIADIPFSSYYDKWCIYGVMDYVDSGQYGMWTYYYYKDYGLTPDTSYLYRFTLYDGNGEYYRVSEGCATEP